jgi:hypothetical protein
VHLDQIHQARGALLQHSNDDDDNAAMTLNDDGLIREILVLASLALYHAYTAQVYYAVVSVPRKWAHFLVEYFRMVQAQVIHKEDLVATDTVAAADDESQNVTMICDLNKCSYRYAFLKYLESWRKVQKHNTEVSQGVTDNEVGNSKDESINESLNMEETSDHGNANTSHPEVEKINEKPSQDSESTQPAQDEMATDEMNSNENKTSETLEENISYYEASKQPSNLLHSGVVDVEVVVYGTDIRDGDLKMESARNTDNSQVDLHMLHQSKKATEINSMTVSTDSKQVSDVAEKGTSTVNAHLDHPSVDAIGPMRCLLRLPNVEDASNALGLRSDVCNEDALATPASSSRSKRSVNRKTSDFFTGASSAAMRQVTVSFRAKLLDEHNTQFFKITNDDETELTIPSFAHDPSVDIFRMFDLPPKKALQAKETETLVEDDEILHLILKNRSDLTRVEQEMEPTLRRLFARAVDERKEYESTHSLQKRMEEKRIWEAYQALLERRAERALAWQRQLEQDMDAVCDVCNDGEVTPDNQILFCESCNVAIHQFCYGVERVPEGDYYCIPCRFLERNKVSSDGTLQPPAPLPICCELCPRKQGAYIRTMMRAKNGEAVPPYGRWVHVVCAKWQGLDIIDGNESEAVEDARELLRWFITAKCVCALCKGKRGAMNQCRHPHCKKWLHVTCARSLGLCEVVHGENVKGPVQINAWTLLCQDHSNINPDDAPKNSLSIEHLEELARFPPEHYVEPRITPFTPFEKATIKEQVALLADEDYEPGLLRIILTEQIVGVRCEICDSVDETGATLIKCFVCSVVCCKGCIFNAPSHGKYKCQACEYIDSQQRLKTEFITPSCLACNMKDGPLRLAFANPVTKVARKRLKDYHTLLFGRAIWIHTLCD